MAANDDFIESLCANQRSSRLRVRVVRVWRQPHYLKTIGNALEMILVDQKVFCILSFTLFNYKCIYMDACFVCC